MGLWERHSEKYQKQGMTIDDIRKKVAPKLPLPKSVEFQLVGEWWDNNWSNAKVDDMTILFFGDEQFGEITMADMRARNEGGGGKVILQENGVDFETPDAGTPVFFDMVYNPHSGVTNDWMLTFKAPLELVPVRCDHEQLCRWFDYENPEKVRLRLDGTLSPDEQEIDYDWW